jgi:UDP-N-acetylmuramoyl-L-alanyl-D-glutamate--2,6-diaminopimelate ligase
METSRSLNELVEVVGGHVVGTAETVISDVTHDSRQAGPGTLFVAIPGEIHDGHSFAPQAVEAGASALCVQRILDLDVPQLVVGSTRRAIGELASQVHGIPSLDIDVVGVTGTNGKTTVTHYVESIMGSNGIPTGLIGTIGSRFLGQDIPSVRTTPEAPDFQRLLAEMRDRGAAKVAVEVSSHALALDRVRGTRFAVGAFTNLTQDHLDFHPSMDAYRAAKTLLFTDYEMSTAVFNVDDPMGRELSDDFGGDQLRVGAGGDFFADGVELTGVGTGFTLTAPGFHGAIDAPVFGDFNVSNLLVAMACCVATGLSVDDVLSAVGELVAVPGRFEVVSEPDDPLVIVDYAHTPDGVAMAVDTARDMVAGRVLVVIGAGGDRDRAKRRPMGLAASNGDLVFVTSDNPRSEDPAEIVDQVLDGVTAPFVRQPDRARAISDAINTAEPGDVVLILGKGHEQGQEIGGEIQPFDDREVARAELNVQRKSANIGTDSGSMGS